MPTNSCSKLTTVSALGIVVLLVLLHSSAFINYLPLTWSGTQMAKKCQQVCTCILKFKLFILSFRTDTKILYSFRKTLIYTREKKIGVHVLTTSYDISGMLTIREYYFLIIYPDQYRVPLRLELSTEQPLADTILLKPVTKSFKKLKSWQEK